MEERIIYFNRKKGWGQIGLGVLILLGDLLFVGGIWAILIFFVGGSFIFFGLKSISAKPQLILSDEGLFIGFKFNKTVSWSSIERVNIKKKEVDFRLLYFLEITLRVKSSGPSNIMKREFLIENLDTKPEEIQNLILKRMGKNIPV